MDKVKKRRLLIGMIAVLSAVGMIALIRSVTWFDWTGFGEDVIVSTSQERDQKGNLTKTITTTTPQSAKTLWDWLSVLGVPFSLAILGFWLQQLQQKRADEQTRLERERTEQQEKFEKERAEQQAKLEKEIAEANQREEALQAYFDRLSTLLVDRNLIAIATKIENSKNIAIDNQSKSSIAEQQELLDAAVGVVQARTLSILRRLRDFQRINCPKKTRERLFSRMIIIKGGRKGLPSATPFSLPSSMHEKSTHLSLLSGKIVFI